MSDAGVDARGDAFFHHFANVDAGRCAAEIEHGHIEEFVLGVGDFVHFHGGVDGVFRRAADKSDDGGCGCHGESADACRFGDGAVADVAAGVFFGESGEVQSFRGGDGCGEPAGFVAQAADTADADAEIGAVARHGGNNGAPFHAVTGVCHRFTCRHHRVEHCQRVVADGFQNVGCHIGIGRGFRHVWRQRFQEQNRTGFVAVVTFVAHVQCLCQQSANINAAAHFHRVGEHGTHHFVEPAQAFQHFFAVCAVTQHFAVTFVDVGIGKVTVCFVFDDIDGHTGGGDARHWTDGIVFVARFQFNFAGCDQFFRFGFVFRFAFKNQRADDCAAHRTGRAFPCDGRTGVQQQVIAHAGNDISRCAQPNQHRMGFHHTVGGFIICFLNINCHEISSLSL